ncbi:unnamed protein product [Caenorhabditis bovis]|uniref:Uncharacterized protein n=1 Tax=Caenorhabditis bovis TaxID=2654633 RepID=A0A8S1ENA7_9PELO|nr:unnamed protein product [Caenorhabditis bovis]
MTTTTAAAFSIIVVALTVCSQCAAGEPTIRAKRQLSPATALETDYLAALYGYEGSPFKRANNLRSEKRQISPSYDVEVNAGNLRNLLDIGKRQVSVASDYGDQFQMYNRLFDAGKKRKRSSVISPAYNFQTSLGLSEALERAG